MLLDDAFRLAVREEVRLTGRGGGDGAGAYFRKGRLTSIPGNAQVRNRVLSVVADSFENRGRRHGPARAREGPGGGGEPAAGAFSMFPAEKQLG